MKYELAKELKEAGFPQPDVDNVTDDQIDEIKGDFVFPPSSEAFKVGDVVYLPTLEELIEACGNQFGALVHYEDKTWRAYHTDDAEGLLDVSSDTPIEAVGRLWLALRKV